MEVPDMEVKNNGSHTASAAAFVEGGIQEACDDSCSICLEDFSENNPSTVTNCKHDFHLQCILEWCQRSSQCPMCWQCISFKDSTSQELFEAVVHERDLRATSSRSATIFQHLAFGDLDLQHLPMGVSEVDIEERIIQHLAAATVMGRAHHLVRREGNRTRSYPHGRPPFIVFSTPPLGAVSAAGGGTEPTAIPVGNPSSPLISEGDEPSQQIPSIQIQSSLPSGSTVRATNRQGINFNDRSTTVQSAPPDQGRAGPSELQSFSESLRSRLGSVSLRYKETISKGTRGWRERLFSRGTSMSDIGTEVRREFNAGIASVSRLMERLETRENNDRAGDSSSSNHLAADTSNQNDGAAHEFNSRGDNTPAACSAGPPSD